MHGPRMTLVSLMEIGVEHFRFQITQTRGRRWHPRNITSFSCLSILTGRKKRAKWVLPPRRTFAIWTPTFNSFYLSKSKNLVFWEIPCFYLSIRDVYETLVNPTWNQHVNIFKTWPGQALKFYCTVSSLAECLMVQTCSQIRALKILIASFIVRYKFSF